MVASDDCLAFCVSNLLGLPIDYELIGRQYSLPDPPGSQVPAMPNDLGSLIDHGLSRNPTTRKAWFEAHAAAAAVGEARAPYYPRVSTRFEGGSDKWYTPPATGPDNYTRVQATPILSIEYLRSPN